MTRIYKHFKKKLFILFIFGYIGSSLQVFSSCGEWGLLFVAVRGLLIVVASLVCGAWALGAQASVVVVCGLQELWLMGSRVQGQ